MVYFRTWSEWIKLKESNARKRAISAALNGTGCELPGSYAANPGTNARAMKIAKKTGKVTSDKKFREEARKPDYSFDKWLKSVEDSERANSELVSKAKETEDEMDKKKKTKPKPVVKQSIPNSKEKEDILDKKVPDEKDQDKKEMKKTDPISN